MKIIDIKEDDMNQEINEQYRVDQDENVYVRYVESEETYWHFIGELNGQTKEVFVEEWERKWKAWKEEWDNMEELSE